MFISYSVINVFRKKKKKKSQQPNHRKAIAKTRSDQI